MPRLPGKPVQNMPPSPHRQGRRGYDLLVSPTANIAEFIVPMLAMAVSLFVTLTGVGVFTCGLGLLAAPWIAMHFVRSGLLDMAKLRRVTLGQAWWFAFCMAALAWTPLMGMALYCDCPSIKLGCMALCAFTMLGATFEATVCCTKYELPCWKVPSEANGARA